MTWLPRWLAKLIRPSAFLIPAVAVKQPSKPWPVREPREPRQWCLALPTPGGPTPYAAQPATAEAMTRSEARATWKRMLGIPRKGRLPVRSILWSFA